MNQIQESMKWAENEFGKCELGDVRRTRRLVKFASQVSRDPSSSTPKQTQVWSDCKAAYRLMDNPQVTFEAITAPHYEQTKSRAGGTWLILNDTTEIDYGCNPMVEGLSEVGSGLGQGFLLHNGLMVDPVSGQVIGLAGQKIRYRKRAPKGETRSAVLKRDRESLLWGQLVEQVGRPPAGVQFINVCDRAADHFEFFCKMLQHQHDWIVRASSLNRRVLNSENTSVQVSEQLETLPVQGTYELTCRHAQQGQRNAQIEVRFDLVNVAAPKRKSPWLRDQQVESIPMNLVEAREVNAPQGVKPLRWVLLTTLDIACFDDAWQVIEHYEKRVIVEEYHKALKTGCRVEQRFYKTADRLEAITALLSITAVRLLQLRSASRTEPTKHAS